MSLFNVAFARQTGGRFVLRIEDTDRARFRADSERQIYDTLSWLGLEWDEGPDKGGPFAPYRQSERLATYRPFVDRLIADGHAYHCWCAPERLAELRREQERSRQAVTGYDRLCHGKTREERAALPGFSETPVVRMLVPDDVPLTFHDLVRGDVAAPRPDDQVILKADGFPTYHLAVVVDDHLMAITHVVRGEEWISSTPKHLLLYRWLGWEAPAFAHMPLLRNLDKSKISKRKNPAARLMWFREQGYLPEALLNFLSLLAYPPVHEGNEVQGFGEFTAAFDWSRVSTTGPVVDLAKLNWLNGEYIRALPPDELAERVADWAAAFSVPSEVEESWPPRMRPLAGVSEDGDGDAARSSARDLLRRATPLIQERLTLLSEALPKLAFLYAEDDALTLADDAVATLPEDAARIVDEAVAVLERVPTWTHDVLQAALRARLVDELGLKAKAAFAPVRVAVTGQRVSPPLFESMELLGKSSCLVRLRSFSVP
jgi:glutamyl-tRNA synthetase